MNFIDYFFNFCKIKKINMWLNLKPINLSTINFIDYPKDQYFSNEDDVYEKTQVIIHHTESGSGVRGDIQTWLLTSKRIATCIIIDRDGTVNQLFSSKYWGAHVGAGKSSLDKHSIGVELDNWGGLILGDGTVKQIGKNSDGTEKYIKTISGKYYATYGNIVNVPVTEYALGFRGYKFYESYTEAQIRSVGELLLFWNKRYNIPLEYNEDMWDVSQKALSGTLGVWTHVSFRPEPEKFDCHPQIELINMLKTISSLI